MKQKQDRKRMPAIIFINILIFVLGVISTIFKLINAQRFQLSAQYFGETLTYFDYFSDFGIGILAIYLVYGYLKRKNLAYKLTYLYYGIYLFGRLIAPFIGYFNFEKVMEMVSLVKYGEMRDLSVITPTFYLWTGLGVFIVNLVIVSLLLFFLRKKKDYWDREAK